MNKPKHLNQGDKVAIVSLSRGLLGEIKCIHQLELGIQRIKEFGLIPVFMENSLKGIRYLYDNPQARAADLKQAFFDDEIKGIICAIGGDDTYRLLPFLLEDMAFVEKVISTPKIFIGFSDTTNNHLMFYKLGMTSYYGPTFLTDFAELDVKMLDYTKEAFTKMFKKDDIFEIKSCKEWFVDRTDFSVKAVGTSRKLATDKHGFDIIYGTGVINGELLGGCLESLYDGYTGDRYPEQKKIYDKFELMPTINEWKNKIMFIETSEEKPSPISFKKYLKFFSEQGILSVIKGMLVGKPIDEAYYEEYRIILEYYAQKHKLPIMYNLNFGHAYPRTIVPYGLNVKLDFSEKKVCVVETLFE